MRRLSAGSFLRFIVPFFAVSFEIGEIKSEKVKVKESQYQNQLLQLNR